METHKTEHGKGRQLSFLLDTMLLIISSKINI